MDWNWRFKVGDRVTWTDDNGAFDCTVAARVMTGGKVSDTPTYSLSVESWDGGTWAGRHITPHAQEVEAQNP